nr:DNA internalization-related competence protein ComEC/Rec2 [Aliidiomarina indica]
MLNLWQLPSTEWRQPAEISIQVESVSIASTERWQFDGRLVDAPARWQLPFAVGRWGAPKVRLHWYFPTEVTPPKSGEIWQFQVRARPATGLANEGSRPAQLRWLRDRIRASVHIQSGEKIQPAAATSLRSYIAEQVRPWQRSVDNPTGLDYTGFLLALMTGNRQDIQSAQWHLFQQTGVAHIMAISGLHLTLVFGFAWWLGRVLWISLAASYRCCLGSAIQCKAQQPSYEHYALLSAWLVAFCYAALADFAVSTVRALILVSFFVVVRLHGLRIAPLRILLRCVALLLLVDPFAWLDPGFWLSVGAVLAIFLWQWRAPSDALQGAPLVQKIISLWRLEVLLTLALIPLTIRYFAGIPWIAPVTNLWVIPIFTLLILPLCLLAALVLAITWGTGHAIEQAAYFILYPADIALHIVMHGLVLSSHVPMHWHAVADQRWSVIPAFWFVWRYWPATRTQRVQMATATSVALLLWLQPAAPHEFAVHMLDVGQGNAVVIQRGRKALVYDAGPRFAGGFDTGRSVVIPFLRYHRLTPEWLVLSHPHQDHVGGAESVQRAYPSVQILETRLQPEVYVGSDLEAQAQTLRWPCEWGQVWRWQGVLIRALAPMPGPSFGPNNDSCVLLLDFSGQRVLLTGDIQRLTELRMVGRYSGSFQADVLQVPHHGSQTSSQLEFIDRVAPKVALVGTGFLNQWGMPHKDVQKRYQKRHIPLFNTGYSGQISVILTGNTDTGFSWKVRPFRQAIQPLWFLQQPIQTD